MRQIALILGPTGRFGRNTAIAFEDAGWEVRRFNRKTDSLWDAAWGAHVIVNGWHPAPVDWRKQAIKIHTDVIEVAEASGATIIMPGNIYSFGSSLPRTLGVDTPHNPDTFYGRIRKQIEDAYRASSTSTIIVRAGDFLDTEASGNWFDLEIIKNLSKGRFSYPGPLNVTHTWAFLPDLARAIVGLAEKRDQLPRFADVPYAGIAMTGQDMADMIADVAGQPVKASAMAWFPLYALYPFWSVARFLVTQRYVWRTPHMMDPQPLADLLPDHRDSSATAVLAAAIQHQVNPDRVVAGELAA